MRILVASPFLPHARVTHGGGVYLRALLCAMARRAELALVCFATPGELEAGAIRRSFDDFARLDIVVRPQRSEFGRLGAVRERGRLLRLWSVGGQPLVAAKFQAAVMHRVIGNVGASFAPAAAMAEFSLMAQYLPALRGVRGVPTVLTDHEACVPVPAQILPGGRGRGRDRRLWDTYFDRWYPRADFLQALNDEDAAVLAERFRRPVAVRPAVVDIPAVAAKPAAAPPRALFLGDYSHHPNPEAAEYLAHAVWPAVRRLNPAAELWLAGPNMGPAVQALAASPGVVIRGFEPDLATLFAACRCVVAPLLSGRGSRIKVLTSLAHGVPVIGNALGLRGVTAGEPAVLARDSVDALGRAIDAYLGDAAMAGRAGDHARRWAIEHVSADAVAAAQIAGLEQLSTVGENSARP